jgi:hypothetical protein
MGDASDSTAHTGHLRPVTRSLITAMLLDVQPSPAAMVDFGIDSQRHYEALYYPLREGEITGEQLDAAYGDGQKLTALARDAPSNPHKDISFHTSWDAVLGRDRGATGGAGGNAAAATSPLSPSEIADRAPEQVSGGKPSREPSHEGPKHRAR